MFPNIAARELSADVIVVGTRGHGRRSGMLLGSVTQRLLHVAPCPVVAVPVHGTEAAVTEPAKPHRMSGAPWVAIKRRRRPFIPHR